MGISSLDVKLQICSDRVHPSISRHARGLFTMLWLCLIHGHRKVAMQQDADVRLRCRCESCMETPGGFKVDAESPLLLVSAAQSCSSWCCLMYGATCRQKGRVCEPCRGGSAAGPDLQVPQHRQLRHSCPWHPRQASSLPLRCISCTCIALRGCRLVWATGEPAAAAFCNRAVQKCLVLFFFFVGRDGSQLTWNSLCGTMQAHTYNLQADCS